MRNMKDLVSFGSEGEGPRGTPHGRGALEGPVGTFSVSAEAGQRTITPPCACTGPTGPCRWCAWWWCRTTTGALV